MLFRSCPGRSGKAFPDLSGKAFPDPSQTHPGMGPGGILGMPSGHARNAQICPNLGFGGFPETPNLPKFGHFFDSVYHYVITNLPKFDISGFPGFRRETPNLPKFGVSGPVREGLPRPIPGMPGKAFPDPSRACPEWVREAPSRTCPGRSGR